MEASRGWSYQGFLRGDPSPPSHEHVIIEQEPRGLIPSQMQAGERAVASNPGRQGEGDRSVHEETLVT